MQIHLDSKFEQKWKEDFKGHVFFSHGNANSCGVLTAYFGKETITAKKQEIDKEGRILILDVSVSDFEYILVNTEKEKINVLSNMFLLLEKFDTNKKKQLIMARYFNLLLEPKLDAQDRNLRCSFVPLHLHMKDKLNIFGASILKWSFDSKMELRFQNGASISKSNFDFEMELPLRNGASISK